jgi:p-aminobenzoyl-glutamate transporter AbgT
MHVPEPIQTIMHDMPAYVQTAMATGAAAVLALADVAWQAITGQVPSPEQAGQWSFYGVLIVAVIVLFSSLASVIYWVATKGLKAFQDLTQAMEKMNETLDKQNDYFDEIAKNAVRSALTTPPARP